MKMRGTYCESGRQPKRRFDSRSFRYIKRGGSWILIGCPKGHWSPSKNRCRVGTQAYKVLRKTKQGQRCRSGERRITKA